MLLKDKICVITGAGSARGLGRATSQLFADNGAKVIVLDINIEMARETAASLNGRGHMALKCDVTTRKDCDKAIARVIARHGRVDVLINNAGITSPHRLMEVDDAIFDRVMDINMRGCFYMTQAVVPFMRQQKSGSIVNMSSVSAQRGGGVFGGSHYAAAKGAMLGYTKACARELGPDNIRVNCINPVFNPETGLSTAFAGGPLDEDRKAKFRASIPLGRFSTALDVANAALYLASDEAAFISGVCIEVDGARCV